ncbi:protein of unknown function [Burkholderia multivorans]
MRLNSAMKELHLIHLIWIIKSIDSKTLSIS